MDNKETADKADVLFLCVKPQFLYGVIDEIKNSVYGTDRISQ